MAASRQWHSRKELQRFSARLDDWLENRRSDQYSTQLRRIQEELTAAAAKIDGAIGGDADVAETYARCARVDRATAWLWRVFEFFATKFDQRDDDDLKDALFAADEVVWSCFRTFAQHLPNASPEPAPLPYIDNHYSPASVRRDRSLASVVDPDSGFDFLSDYLRTLPIPVLRLPATIVHAPWVLVIIAHETGHFLQPLFAPNHAEAFAQTIDDAARAVGASKAQAALWADCSGEIFADWISVALMGPAARWAMAQFELAPEVDMRRQRSREGYPSAAARLQLMAELAPPNVGQLDVPHADEVDAAVASAIAQTLVKTPLAGDVTFDAASIESWKNALTKKQTKTPRRRLWEARQLAAASAHAWSELAFDDDASRDAAATALRDATFRTIRDSAVEGTRAASSFAQAKDPGAALAERLLSLDVPETIAS